MKDSRRSFHRELLFGLQPVCAALRHRKREFSELFIKIGKKNSEPISEIRKLAEEIGLPVNEVPGNRLKEMCPDVVHQGVILRCSILPFSNISDLSLTLEGELPLIVVLDPVSYTHLTLPTTPYV